MIASFRHNALGRVWETNNTRGLDSRYVRVMRRGLEALDEATTVEQLNVPGFGLHALRGDMAGRWAVTVSQNWRITFAFVDGNAHEIDLEDYH